MSFGDLLGEIAITALLCIPLGLSLWALLDCARRPGWAWALSDHERVHWLFAILVGFLCVIGGLTISLWYLLRIRPDIADIESGALGKLSTG
ncbi:MAG: hypothetical protein N2037_09150 [Acidimicrobiales bacterium]|nr:hypothetical protein [Acidimicrobiales bacterium]